MLVVVAHTRTRTHTHTQGLSFTSFLSEVSGSRAMKDDEMFHAEIGKWQKLFLQLVDLRAEGAEEHLKRFLQGNAVTKKQRQELTKMVRPLAPCMCVCSVSRIKQAD